MMFFGRRKIEKLYNLEEREKKARSEDPLELEKSDLPAIIIAALITFIPVFLFLAALLLGMWWVLVGRF